MHDLAVQAEEDEDVEYVIIPEEAFTALPKEMRLHFEKLAEDGRSTLRSVDRELNQTARIARSMAHFVTVKYALDKLRALSFEPTIEYFCELDMLTTAFVVTYARFQQGKGGMGFDPSLLPTKLRKKHDEIIALRNTRFAHDDAKAEFISNAMEISFVDDKFIIHPALSIKYQIGGDPEWVDLITEIDGLLVDRNVAFVKRLSDKTGKEWTFAVPPEGQ